MYLYGKEFQVETDHYPLIYMQSAKLTNSRVMRWVLSLPYKFQLKAIKGVHNIGADYLSRKKNEFHSFFCVMVDNVTKLCHFFIFRGTYRVLRKFEDIS